MNIRSCADFAGPTNVGNLNISAVCVGITQDQVREVMSLEMSSNLELRGGSDETRNQLRISRSDT